MRIFTLDETYNVVCNFEKTRNGFRHIAVLHKNGFEIARAKETYLNRTYECYEFETVLYKIVNDFIAQCDQEKYREVIKNFR
jgi:hypothetical protein